MKTTKQRFEMAQEDLEALLEASKPVIYMVFGGVPPASPQENANRAWCALGRKMGFDGMSVEPSGEGDRIFYANPIAVSEPSK